LDIGASIGDYTVRAARAAGQTGKVVAVEPHPVAYSILLANIELNRLTNVLPVKVAVSDTVGQLTMAGEKIATLVERGSRTDEYTVPSTTIDNLLESLGVGGASAMKMDIEGGEAKALLNQAHIDRMREMAIEIHGESLRKDLVRHFERRGFRATEVAVRDLQVNSVRTALGHLPSAIASEVATHFYALRYVWGYASGHGSKMFTDINRSRYRIVHFAKREK